MTTLVNLFVPGRARTKGHMQPVHQRGTAGRPCTWGGAKDRPELKAWMQTLQKALMDDQGIVLARRDGRVQRVDGGTPYAGAVEVHCFFRFDRELSVAAGAEAGEPWPTHAQEHPVATGMANPGDEDTLRRAALDALTKAGVLADDCYSIGGMNYKRWCSEGEAPGVHILVHESVSADAVRELERYWTRKARRES